jgi:hypothetical protein
MANQALEKGTPTDLILHLRPYNYTSASSPAASNAEAEQEPGDEPMRTTPSLQVWIHDLMGGGARCLQYYAKANSSQSFKNTDKFIYKHPTRRTRS